MTTYEKNGTKRWRLAGTVAAVAVTTAAGGVAWAAGDLGGADPTPSASPSSSASPSTPSDETKPGRPGGLGGKHGFMGAGRALHGEFVVPKEGGGYQTVATQRGDVTAVSAESITVKSEDGYSRTYTLTEDTLVNAARDGIADVKTGNKVHVSAIVDGDKATAVSVNDGTTREAAREKWGLKRGPR